MNPGNALDLKIPPVLLGAVVGFLMWLRARALPTLAFTIPHTHELALGLVLLGALIAVSGVVSFRRARTTVNPTKPDTASSLVTIGICLLYTSPSPRD